MKDNRTPSLHASLLALLKPATPLSEPVAEWSEWPGSYSNGTGTVRAQAGRRAKIVVIARERLIRECLVRCLQRANGNTIESVATVAEWIALSATESPPSLILLYRLGLGDRAAEIEGDLRSLAELGSNAPVVLFSDEVDVSRIQAAFELGVRGYIPTSVPLDVALIALRVVQAGGILAPASRPSVREAQSETAKPNSEPRTVVPAPTQIAVGEAIRRGKQKRTGRKSA